MIISPKTAIEQGWIIHPDCNNYEDWVEKKYVSPNAIDFTVDSMMQVNTSGLATITEKTRTHHTRITHPVTNGVEWHLNSQSLYDCESMMYVKLPDGVMCTLAIRSSFARNGVLLNSGLYDQGYNGTIGFTLYNTIGSVVTKSGTRVGQIVFHQAIGEGMYEGHYSHKQGESWTDKDSNIITNDGVE